MWEKKDFHASDVVQAVYRKFPDKTWALDEGRTLIAQMLLLAESVVLVAKLESTYIRVVYLLMYEWTARHNSYDVLPSFYDMNGMSWFWSSERDLARFVDEPVTLD